MSKVWRLRSENDKNSRKLNDRNNKLYTSFVCYIEASSLTEDERIEIQGDVLYMFLQWQEQGNSIEEMVGGNLQKFADDTIEAVNSKRGSIAKLKEDMGIIINCFFIMLTIDLGISKIPEIFLGKLNLRYDYSLSWSIATITVIVVSWILVHCIGKNSFKMMNDRKGNFTKKLFVGACVGTFLGLFIVLMSETRGKIVFSINMIYILIIIVIYWGYNIINKMYMSK